MHNKVQTYLYLGTGKPWAAHGSSTTSPWTADRAVRLSVTRGGTVPLESAMIKSKSALVYSQVSIRKKKF